MSDWHPVAIFMVGLIIVALPLTIGAAIVKVAREHRTALTIKAPESTDDLRCPCGAKATRPRPRYRVWDLPVVGRVVRRERDSFGILEICDAHAEVANAVIDERIAIARLSEAHAERERITQLANSGDVLQEIVQTLPEDRQKAYARSLRPLPVVKILPAPNGEEQPKP